MTQVTRNKIVAREVGERLGVVLDNYTGRSATAIAAALGYKNATVLSRARHGHTSLSAEKLQALARLTLESGANVSLHWLLTGEGSPTTEARTRASQAEDVLAQRVHEASPRIRAQIEAYLNVTEPTPDRPVERRTRAKTHSADKRLGR